MGKKKKRKKEQKKRQYSPISSHKKEGTLLKAPLSVFNMDMIDWPRNLLPEHLWIAALADYNGLDKFHVQYNKFMDTMDKYMPKDFVSFGLISDFGLVPEEQREICLRDNEDQINMAFSKPISRILSFYPECPAYWLIKKNIIERDGRLDPDVELGRLRVLVDKLMPGKDEFAARIRVVPFTRLLKHDKVRFSKNLPVVELIPKYPHKLSEDDRYHVESIVRSQMNLSISHRNIPEPHKWSKYFWRHNYNIVSCRPVDKEIVTERAVSEDQGKEILNMMAHNSSLAKEYLTLLKNVHKVDLYDPSKDEILFGLFARLTRLLCLFLDDPYLWARDVSGIFLRCLTDTSILFVYLIKKGTDKDFKDFIQYGEGQQKLLMLHLQDSYPDEKSPEGLSTEEIGEGLGFMPELIDVELGNWAKKDTRKLAKEAGMERQYRLVYSPTSSDLHGTWMSLKNSNLVYCNEPLHRFHRLPSFAEPPFYLNIAFTAIELYEFSRDTAIRYQRYPEAKDQFKKFNKKPS
jgi:hypothetical protein